MGMREPISRALRIHKSARNDIVNCMLKGLRERSEHIAARCDDNDNLPHISSSVASCHRKVFVAVLQRTPRLMNYQHRHAIMMSMFIAERFADRSVISYYTVASNAQCS